MTVQKTTKWFMISLAALVSIFLVALSWSFYQDQHEKSEYVKEEALKQIKIESTQLETRAKFLNIKLGTPISRYNGFMPFDFTSSICNYTSATTDINAHEKAWGYFLSDRRYSSVGHYQLGSHQYDLQSNGKRLSEKQKRESDAKIMIFTLDGKIYKIHADIEELVGIMHEEGKSINSFLHTVYGPSVDDNGHNDVNYLSTDDLKWESKSVLLTTVTETKSNYVNNRLSMLQTNITHVEYLFKPLQKKLNQVQVKSSNREVQEAIDKL